jgi:hypothetical protein
MTLPDGTEGLERSVSLSSASAWLEAVRTRVAFGRSCSPTALLPKIGPVVRSLIGALAVSQARPLEGDGSLTCVLEDIGYSVSFPSSGCLWCVSGLSVASL